ncbi:unnamed protein product [Notodromas monacha]|uniref:Suppressor of fused homolog n=1 Tax=Notodromas monacha TaxID=399045 RepID=A0A7R9GEA1_9CRUS|nr:unnamed protein product [Notodromas monacha]CAG0917663.1 unnamed protein product [Notodromas monacha]
MARSLGLSKILEPALPDVMETALPHGARISVHPPATPPGLAALFEACRATYPDQPNPLQVNAVVKYWLGGPDPLDYISMYANPGDPVTDTPAHWHYISFGLSDLHGDGRVHARNLGDQVPNQPSGFGFELSFRLKSLPEEDSPPTWPAAIMQALARYVFKFRNLFCVGDHISWNCPIDGGVTQLQHFLLAEDPQLGVVLTPCGSVQFLQLVGITDDELRTVQHWNGPEILSVIRRVMGCGGDWLVTDLARESVFACDPSVKEDVRTGILRDGSNLSGVSAQCCWCEMISIAGEVPSTKTLANSITMASFNGNSSSGIDALTGSMSCMAISQDLENVSAAQMKHNNSVAFKEPGMRSISAQESQQLCNVLRRDSATAGSSRYKAKSSSIDVVARSTNQAIGEYLGGNLESTAKSLEFIPSKLLNGVHLCFNYEAGNLLPLALQGRVMHGRHFTFQGVAVGNDDANVVGGNVITFVAEKVKGTWASVAHPYASRGSWLHVLLTPTLAENIFFEVQKALAEGFQTVGPRTLEWPEHKMTMSPKKGTDKSGASSGTGTKTKKKKSGSGRAPVIVDGLPIGEMSREQVEDLVYRMRAEMDRERAARNRAELELTRVNSFWSIAQSEASSLKDNLTVRDRELEETAKRHASQVKEHKQRVKSLLFEQRASIGEIQEGIVARIATERDEHRQREGELRLENTELKLAAQHHEVSSHEMLRDAALKHAAELKATREKFESSLDRLEKKWEARYSTFKADADVQRESELHQLSERKNAQIRSLIEKHDRAFVEVKTYYDDITLNNLALINCLKNELATVKAREEKLEKEAAERASENKRLAEPLEKAKQELAEVRVKLSARERETELVRKAESRSKEAAKISEKLRWENERLQNRLIKIQKERDELYEKFVKAIAEVREKNAAKSIILEKQLSTLNAAVEAKDVQLDEVMRSSSSPAVAASLAKKIEDVIETKNATIANLKREVAELCVAHNDLLGGNMASNCVPVRPSFA